jgi:hypothetical protein
MTEPASPTDRVRDPRDAEIVRLRRLLSDAEQANRALAEQLAHIVGLLSEARTVVRNTWPEEQRARAEGRL